jgi:D-aminoacyl-tRNA deacylase
MFVELGSSPIQWRDDKAAEAVAHAVDTALTSTLESSTVVLGIGGPHYSEKFTRIALKEDVAFGHMIPKYAIAQIDKKTIGQCIERTLEKVEVVFLDWKGIRGVDKTHLVKALEAVGVEFEKV